MMEGETFPVVWMEITGIPSHVVSNTGEVRSKDRISTIDSTCRHYHRKVKGHLLRRVFTKRSGKLSYVRVSINDQSYLVHRLVAKTFLSDSYFQGAHVNHKNGNKQDNRVENLEWVTPSENELHSHRVLGKQTWNSGIPFPNPNAVAVRRKNYHIRCFELLFWKEISHWTDKKLANFCGLSSRQVNQNLQVARKERSSHE